MKAVMMSIRPKWCELIADGKKTVEVRKTRPKIEVPFKVYIYCTQPKYEHEDFITVGAGTDKAFAFYGGGKVIGEFVCARIEDYSNWKFDIPALYRHINLYALVDYPELYSYLPNGGGYGWHISDLEIYRKPMPLSVFIKPCDHKNDCCTCKRFDKKHFDCISGITRPPQSWCYVEELR